MTLMMENLTLKISVNEINAFKRIQFKSNVTVRDVCKIIREKSPKANFGPTKDYGLFLPKENPMDGVWLEDDKTLEYYLIRDGDSIEYKRKTRKMKVRMLDGSVKTVLIDDSRPVAEHVAIICSKICIRDHEEYALIRETMDAKTTGGTLTMPKRKGDEDSKMDQLRKRLKTDEELNWVHPALTLREQGINEDETLLFTRKYFFSHKNIDFRDPTQLNLLYVQTRNAIIDGTHPVTKQEAIKFAGIQCQIQFKDHNERIEKHSFLDAKEFLPKEYAKIRGILKPIFAEHKTYSGVSEVEAKYKYVSLARSLKTFGVTFFLVKEVMKGRNKLIPRLLGVTRDSILRLDKKTKEIIKSWPLSSIRRWTASANSFTLDLGDYSDSYYSVKTTDGDRISHLISGYIDLILRKRKSTDYSLNYDEHGFIVEDNVVATKVDYIQHEFIPDPRFTPDCYESDHTDKSDEPSLIPVGSPSTIHVLEEPNENKNIIVSPQDPKNHEELYDDVRTPEEKLFPPKEKSGIFLDLDGDPLEVNVNEKNSVKLEPANSSQETFTEINEFEQNEKNYEDLMEENESLKISMAEGDSHKDVINSETYLQIEQQTNKGIDPLQESVTEIQEMEPLVNTNMMEEEILIKISGSGGGSDKDGIKSDNYSPLDQESNKSNGSISSSCESFIRNEKLMMTSSPDSTLSDDHPIKFFQSENISEPKIVLKFPDPDISSGKNNLNVQLENETEIQETVPNKEPSRIKPTLELKESPYNTNNFPPTADINKILIPGNDEIVSSPEESKDNKPLIINARILPTKELIISSPKTHSNIHLEEEDLMPKNKDEKIKKREPSELSVKPQKPFIFDTDITLLQKKAPNKTLPPLELKSSIPIKVATNKKEQNSIKPEKSSQTKVDAINMNSNSVGPENNSVNDNECKNESKNNEDPETNCKPKELNNKLNEKPSINVTKHQQEAIKKFEPNSVLPAVGDVIQFAKTTFEPQDSLQSEKSSIKRKNSFDPPPKVVCYHFKVLKSPVKLEEESFNNDINDVLSGKNINQNPAEGQRPQSLTDITVNCKARDPKEFDHLSNNNEINNNDIQFENKEQGDKELGSSNSPPYGQASIISGHDTLYDKNSKGSNPYMNDSVPSLKSHAGIKSGTNKLGSRIPKLSGKKPLGQDVKDSGLDYNQPEQIPSSIPQVGLNKDSNDCTLSENLQEPETTKPETKSPESQFLESFDGLLSDINNGKKAIEEMLKELQSTPTKYNTDLVPDSVRVTSKLESISTKLTAINASTAQIIEAKSNPERIEEQQQILSTGIHSITTILSQMPTDLKVIIPLMQVDDNRNRLLDAVRNLCDAFSQLLKVAEESVKVNLKPIKIPKPKRENSKDFGSKLETLVNLSKPILINVELMAVNAIDFAAQLQNDDDANCVKCFATKCSIATAKLMAAIRNYPQDDYKLLLSSRNVLLAAENTIKAFQDSKPHDGLLFKLKDCAENVFQDINNLINYLLTFIHMENCLSPDISLAQFEVEDILNSERPDSYTQNRLLSAAKAVVEATTILLDVIFEATSNQPQFESIDIIKHSTERYGSRLYYEKFKKIAVFQKYKTTVYFWYYLTLREEVLIIPDDN